MSNETFKAPKLVKLTELGTESLIKLGPDREKIMVYTLSFNGPP